MHCTLSTIGYNHVICIYDCNTGRKLLWISSVLIHLVVKLALIKNISVIFISNIHSLDKNLSNRGVSVIKEESGVVVWSLGIQKAMEMDYGGSGEMYKEGRENASEVSRKGTTSLRKNREDFLGG